MVLRGRMNRNSDNERLFLSLDSVVHYYTHSHRNISSAVLCFEIPALACEVGEKTSGDKGFKEMRSQLWVLKEPV